MGLKGKPDTLRRFSAIIEQFGYSVSREVARRAAPALTATARATFGEGKDPYGVTWEPGKSGDSVDLVREGKLLDYIKYVATGTVLRIALGVKYAKYQIGKRKVFPGQDQELPQSYLDTLAKVTGEVVAEEVRALR